MNVADLFDEALERPALYIGHESVILLKAFLDGYEFANFRNGLRSRDSLYAGFQPWVAKRFHIKTEHDWASIISFIGVSETCAFSLLNDLWSEYKASTN